MNQTEPKRKWWETSKTWFCSECGAENPMGQQYCAGCDCSLEGFVDENWLDEFDMNGMMVE